MPPQGRGGIPLPARTKLDVPPTRAAHVNLSRVRSPGLLRAHAILLLLTATLLPTLGRAQESLADRALEQQGLTRVTGGWDVTLGAGLAEAPKYPGASTERVRPAPLFSLDYDGRLFVGPLGIGVAAVRWDGFRAGPVLGFERGRSQSDDPHLAGLGDIPASLTAGLFAGYTRGALAIYATARQAVTHTGDGLSGLLQLDVRHAFITARTFVAVGPDLEFGNDRFQRAWFGISPEQSASSGLPTYTPGAGIDRIGLHVRLTYRASAHFLVLAFARISDLTGTVAQSPIVERRGQVVIGAGIAYHF